MRTGHKNYFKEVIKITQKTFKLLRARHKSTIKSDYNQIITKPSGQPEYHQRNVLNLVNTPNPTRPNPVKARASSLPSTLSTNSKESKWW